MHDIDFTDAFCGRLFFAHMLGRNNHGGGNKFSSCSFCGGEWRVVNGKCICKIDVMHNLGTLS